MTGNTIAGAVSDAASSTATRTRVKICGLHSVADVAAANLVRPDFVGFIVNYPKSHRSVSPEEVCRLAGFLEEGIDAVGVFVDAPVEEVAELANTGAIRAVQLHGAEDEDYIARLRTLAEVPVMKAFRLGAAEDSNAGTTSNAAARDDELFARIEACSADMILLDAGAGDGRAFDWSRAKRMRRPFFLAGGLNSENVSEALCVSGTGFVDVSSGVETDGSKDAEKMEQLMEAVRAFDTARNGRIEPLEGQSMTTGYFGTHGGQFIPETLMNAIIELNEAYDHYRNDPDFQAEYRRLLTEYAGRPSNLYFAERMTEDLGGAKIYLKREDLNHTGSHKINNVLGQVLLAKKMGKTRVIAETGAGQHGVATATVAALMGMECEVFMGREDTERQALNVFRMRLLGSKVHPVDSGTATLKDAVSEAMREWTRRVADTHYVLGSCMGPHPFPTIVRDFQAVISEETREQCLAAEGKLPDVVMACVGGGSNAIGSFYNFIEDEGVRLIGCEAAGRGIDTSETAATIATGSEGILHGMRSYFCQDEFGQIAPVYSISAGLDYPGIGPEHAHLFDIGRAEYVAITDDEAVDAFEYLSRTEGIIPAIESAHALAHAMKIAPDMPKDSVIVITLSGRGDKDCAAIARYRGVELYD